MKKTGQRVAMIGTALYNIEVVRVCYSKKKTKSLFFIKISMFFFFIRLNEKKKHVVVQ